MYIYIYIYPNNIYVCFVVLCVASTEQSRTKQRKENNSPYNGLTILLMIFFLKKELMGPIMGVNSNCLVYEIAL